MSFRYLPRCLRLRAGQLAVANDLGEHVRLTQDQNLVGPELDLGPGVLAGGGLGALLLIEDLDDQTVTKRLQVHALPSCSDDFVTSLGTLQPGVPGHSNVDSPRSARQRHRCVTKAWCAGSFLRAGSSSGSCVAARCWPRSAPRASRKGPGHSQKG